jgi:hypothetical protein
MAVHGCAEALEEPLVLLGVDLPLRQAVGECALRILSPAVSAVSRASAVSRMARSPYPDHHHHAEDMSAAPTAYQPPHPHIIVLTSSFRRDPEAAARFLRDDRAGTETSSSRPQNTRGRADCPGLIDLSAAGSRLLAATEEPPSLLWGSSPSP